MSTIYTDDGAYGREPLVGTRDEWRAALAPMWADWHRDADTDMPLGDWIEQSLDRSLRTASADLIARFARLPAVARLGLSIVDCQGASSADVERGIEAAELALRAAGITTAEAATAAYLAESDAWQAADRAAIAACCAGWYRVPDEAHLEAALGAAA